MPSPRWSAVALLSAVLFLWSFSARSETGAVQPVPPAVYGDCTKVPRPSAWTEPEWWAWGRICANKIADLSVYDLGPTDAAKRESWPAARQISFNFLKTILLVEPYRSAVPPAGVGIANARFRDSIDLSHVSMIRDLSLKDSYFDRDLTIEGSHIPGALSFAASQFAAGLDLYESRIEGDLDLGKADVQGDIQLEGTSVGGEAQLARVKVKGTLHMYRFHVEGGLAMAHLAGQADLDLQGATIGGYVELTSATIAGNIIMEVMQDNGALFAKGMHVGTRDAAEKVSGGQIDLHAAQIKGNAEFTDAQVVDILDMTKIAIGRDLLLNGQGRFADIDLTGAWVGGNADLTKATIEKKLDMYRMHIERDLTMDNLNALDDVSLKSAMTGGLISMTKAQVAGDLDMETLQDNGSLLADGLQVAAHNSTDESPQAEITRDTPQIKSSRGKVKLNAAQIKGDVIFTDTQIESDLDMTSIVVGRDLQLIGKGKYAEIYLGEARIGGNLTIAKSEFGRPIHAANAYVAGELLIKDSPWIAKDCDFTALRTGGSVHIQSGVFSGHLLMNDAVIGQELTIGLPLISDNSAQSSLTAIEFRDSVEIKRTRIAGDAQIEGAILKFVGNDMAEGMAKALREHAPTGTSMPTMIDMQAIQVGGELKLGQKTSFDDLVNLAFAHIAGNLDLTEGSFRGVNLTGATIDSEIRLGSPPQQPASWQPPEMLNLRNVSAGALQDLPGESYWPGVLDLDGFAYGRLGGSRTKGGMLADRSADAFEGWLDKQAKPSPQSFIQLAQVLRASGFSDKADAILYAGRKREMQQATGGRKFFLMLEYLVTGFGIYPLRALISIGALVLLGTVLFGLDGRKRWREFRFGDWIVYSLDMLLPVVHLREKNNLWEPHFWPVRYYLYLHRLIGFLLASVIIASLTHGSIELHG